MNPLYALLVFLKTSSILPNIKVRTVTKAKAKASLLAKCLPLMSIGVTSTIHSEVGGPMKAEILQ